MLLSALLLSAVVVAQEPPAAAAPPAPATAATAVDTEAIAAGLAAFKVRHYRAALAEFEKAEAANPQSAAAAFYLGYTYYKLGEPSRRMNANKEKARELFAKAFSLDPAFRPAWGR
jgi:tetratricopeptide (TPR) repeat protein